VNLVAIAALCAGATTLALTPVMRRIGVRAWVVDVPNERSSHDRPTPRTGGYAVVAGICAGSAAGGALQDSRIQVVVLAVAGLTILARLDERQGLSNVVRLTVHVLLSALVLWSVDAVRVIPSVPGAVVAGIAALVVLVGLVNAYNFMDGLNGIAGTVAVVSGLSLTGLAWQHGDVAVSVLAMSTTAAAAGFLPLNLPGRIFLGDSGSTSLGLVFGAIAVINLASNHSWAAASLLPLLPFILDTGITLVRRILHRERFFSTPHRSHFYQRLQQAGWPHVAVASLYGGLSVLGGVVALVFDRLGPLDRVVAVALLVAVHSAVFASIHAAWRRRNQRGE